MDFKFEFERGQIGKIPRDKIVSELEKVAKIFKYTDFKQVDFDKNADISYFTVNREFGSWEKAMLFLVDYFKNKDIVFKITTRRSTYNDRELFSEMERIWVLLGHRPSISEWINAKPKISYDTYARHFKGWQNACLKFIEYKSGKKISIDDEAPLIANKTFKTRVIKDTKTKKIDASSARNISLSLRIKVLSRDNFRCVFCGRSPATDVGVQLHIDHILPFSKGGAATLDNLQTLCLECNLGKSNKKL